MSLPSWVPEIETKPAPMPLLVVQSFVNTWEADTRIDQLADARSTARWLAAAGLIDAGARDLDAAGASGEIGPDGVALDVHLVRAVREAIRALLVHNGGGPPPDPSALAALEAVSGPSSPLGASIDAEGRVDLLPGETPTAWTARLLLIIRDAQREGSWARLKACRNDECLWAFYDRSHAQRGAWCDMAVCGNRIKNRNLRSRRAAIGS